MKYSVLFTLLFIFSFSFSQVTKTNRSCITIGILQGGGSLIGADVEFLVTKKFSFQVGAGLVGYGYGINYHLEPSIKSSFFSLQYWNQGFKNSFAQNVIGPTYVYRGKKWFTAQLGLGKTLDKGPAYPDNIEQPKVIFLYSIGLYIPYE